jgi:hypothetical protein
MNPTFETVFREYLEAIKRQQKLVQAIMESNKDK